MRHSENGRLKFGTLSWLRERIVRIEREIKLYNDEASVKSGKQILQLANDTLHRAEVLLAKDGHQDPVEVEAIEGWLLEIEQSQWGFMKIPKVSW